MTTYLLTEGPFEVALLERLLTTEERQHVELVAAGGLASMKSLARSLVVRRGEPMILVVDADTTSFDLAQEREATIHEVVSSVRGQSPLKIIMARPALERLFFEDRSLLEDVLQQPVPSEVRVNAEEHPREALATLLQTNPLGRTLQDLPVLLSDQHVARLRQTPLVQEILSFMHQVAQSV